MSEIEGVEAEYLSVLDADTIPNDNQTHLCLSCETPFTGVYCNSCGQKNDNYRRSLFSLIIELGSTLTAIEGRIWRTWGALLFKPGKVAREFADGARMKWSSPIRTYIAMSLILFGFLAITETHIFSLDVNVKPKDGVTLSRDELTHEDLSFEFDVHMLERQRTIDARIKNRDFELIERKMLDEEGDLRLDFQIGEEEDDVTSPSLNEPNSKVEDLPEAQPENIEIGGDLGELTVNDRGQIMLNNRRVEGKDVSNFVFDFMQNPAVVTDSLRVYLPRLMFFMMPLTMFIGAIFIRGRGNAMLYDHIIHAAYIHSVVFFLLFTGIIASYVFPGTVVAQAIFIGLLIYLPISLKRMFARGWLKTLWTSYAVGFIYLFILCFGLVIILAMTLKDLQG